MQRLDRFRETIGQNRLAFLFKHESIRYLSGYTGGGVLVVHPGGATIITDFRYAEQAKKQAPNCALMDVPYMASLRALIERFDAKAVYFEDDGMTLRSFREYEQELGGLEWLPLSGQLEAMRLIKDEAEADILRRAVAIADDCFEVVLGHIRPGVTELEIAAVFADYFKRNAEGDSFPAIVASGPNGAMPHAVPSKRKLEKGDLITMDFGCRLMGYCSDTTRTVALGRPDDEWRAVYEAVLEAQKRALDILSPKRTGKEVDAAARDYLEALYPGAFGHGLGHGVGLQVHESPRLNTQNTALLPVGAVVTVEPGLYLYGRGGVRIEDMCMLVPGGHENFTKAPKKLLVL